MSEQEVSGERRTFIKSSGALAAVPLVGGVAGAAEDERTEARGSERGEDGDDRRVVGYYPSWASEYGPRDVPYDKITHLNYAFLEPTSEGEVKLAVTGDADPELLEEFREVTHEQPDTSFVFSIQAGWYSGRFSDAASTAERRERFARTAIDLVEKYNFDGIDIDWEYPDGTIREEDPHNLVLLFREIRRQFDELESEDVEDHDDDGDREDGEDDRSYELSMAASANPRIIDTQKVEALSDLVDFLNVMNYDFHGTWNERTHFNAPLYPVPDAPNANPEFTANHAMRHWASKPIAKEKLNFGLPFYGRTFENVQNDQPSDHGLFQPFAGGGARTYGDIMENVRRGTDYEYHWHSEARVPWLYSEADDVFISYDDRHSIREKTKYTVDNDFGGMMCWELSQDPSNVLLETIDRHLARDD
ncbi:glycosyl hydrolase family 18 protein [Halorussus halophilus]|uniref:glycosyl hydrolase family 18 protein n=1 Tax=Halorussus halophilus TaxID=2650975 RepID=UPI0013012D1E|nr:glycosyl hydrolase family 18 protein [Halorussus halophilus]